MLAFVIAACNNSTSNQNTAESDQDSMSNMEHASTDHSSGMSMVMDKMMNDMHQMEMSGNVDVDYATMMIGHHQAAVDMAQVQIDSGTDDKLKSMAKKIIEEQKAEISELQNFLSTHQNPVKNYDPSKKEEGFAKLMDENMSMMMNMPKMESETTTDQQFVDMMIPHHQGAVSMAEGFVQYGKDSELISMAKKMIADQNREIKDFQNWKENKSN